MSKHNNRHIDHSKDQAAFIANSKLGMPYSGVAIKTGEVVPVVGDRCDNCIFSLKNTIIRCRRFPPSIAGHDTRGPFPLVAADSWCGEYRRCV